MIKSKTGCWFISFKQILVLFGFETLINDDTNFTFLVNSLIKHLNEA